MKKEEDSNKYIEYRELNNFDELKKCISIQKKTLGFSDTDIIPPPLLNVFARKKPTCGIVVGAFEVDQTTGNEELIGFQVNTALLKEEAIFGILLAVLPEYQNKNIGYHIYSKFREVALSNNINLFYCLFDPLEANLGNAYSNKFGFIGIEYVSEVYELQDDVHTVTSAIPNDKIYAKCELAAPRTSEKFDRKYKKIPFEEILSRCPIIDEKNYADNDRVLVEVPDNFMTLVKNNVDEAIRWRMSTRKIFTEYINNRGFWMTEFYSQQKEGKRSNYYLLEKK